MRITEDVTLDGWLSLYIAITWYVEISPEQARRIIEGRSNMKKKHIPTPEMKARVQQIHDNPSFSNYTRLQRRLGVTREEINEMMGEQKMYSVEWAIKDIMNLYWEHNYKLNDAIEYVKGYMSTWEINELDTALKSIGQVFVNGNE